MRRVSLLLAAIGLCFWGPPTAAAEDAPASSAMFKGATSCKICHKADRVFPTWEETAHARAFASLPEDQRDNDRCRECHATGLTEKGELLEGVQCEACHGPGSAYSKKSVMEDRELAMAKGLIVPDEASCVRCHTDALPKECGQPAQDNFAFDLMKIAGVHALKIHQQLPDSVEVIDGE